MRTALRYYEQNLGWMAIPEAFASGTVGAGPGAEPVARSRAVRLPDPAFEPPFEAFQPFGPG